MDDIQTNAVEVQLRKNQKKYARNYMLERLHDTTMNEIEEGVATTTLNPQEQNVLNIMNKYLPVRYPTGSKFKKDDYSVPLIPINRQHTTVDKRTLLYC